MVDGGQTVSTGVVAARLKVSHSTVLNWLRSRKLDGVRGSQPVRPRWYVRVNDAGQPLRPDGTPAESEAAGDLDELIEEVRRLRETVEAGRPVAATGTVRALALSLKGSSERQQRALELQAEAIRELSAALQEQGEAIAQVLLPDTVADILPAET